MKFFDRAIASTVLAGAAFAAVMNAEARDVTPTQASGISASAEKIMKLVDAVSSKPVTDASIVQLKTELRTMTSQEVYQFGRAYERKMKAEQPATTQKVVDAAHDVTAELKQTERANRREPKAGS